MASNSDQTGNQAITAIPNQNASAINNILRACNSDCQEGLARLKNDINEISEKVQNNLELDSEARDALVRRVEELHVSEIEIHEKLDGVFKILDALLKVDTCNENMAYASDKSGVFKMLDARLDALLMVDTCNEIMAYASDQSGNLARAAIPNQNASVINNILRSLHTANVNLQDTSEMNYGSAYGREDLPSFPASSHLQAPLRDNLLVDTMPKDAGDGVQPGKKKSIKCVIAQYLIIVCFIIVVGGLLLRLLSDPSLDNAPLYSCEECQVSGAPPPLSQNGSHNVKQLLFAVGVFIGVPAFVVVVYLLAAQYERWRQRGRVTALTGGVEMAAL